MARPTDDDDPSRTAPDQSAHAPSGHPTLAPGDVLAGRYEIARFLGRGGMGLVFQAHDRTLGVDVAVKVLRPDLACDRRWAERLAHEVKLARRLHHPNVCRVFDFEQADGHVFLVMELAAGSLRAEMEAGAAQARPADARIADARAVATGLAAIHAAGIVHRDVSPRNLLRTFDGRLVVSDFGLATITDDIATSIHGGTVAYMAPEVLRGERATFASDVWSLGVVAHEIVFGQRPTWRGQRIGREMEPPSRALPRAERAVLEACRALVVEAPAARPGDAIHALRVLDGADRIRTRRLQRRVAAIAAAGALVISLVSVGYRIQIRRGESAGPPSDPAMNETPIAVTGTPANWTDSSRVLATVPGFVRCLVILPDRHTLRFTWGTPPHAEDIDIRTGLRRPSPLVPAAYSEGCPDVSPDGQLVFQGYDKDGRPSIFKSPHPDGSNAVLATLAEDPSLLSEPKWVADGKAMIFEVDHSHLGVIERGSNRVMVLPVAQRSSDWNFFHFVNGKKIFTMRLGIDQNRTNIDAIFWPGLEVTDRFAVSARTLYWQTPNGDIFYCVEEETGIIEVDPARRRAQRMATVPGQKIGQSVRIENGLAFVTLKETSDAWIRTDGGPLHRLSHDGRTRQIADCGRNEFLISTGDDGNPWEIERVDTDGHVKSIAQGWVGSPACSRSSGGWWLIRYEGSDAGLHHCSDAGCTRIFGGWTEGLALSPDESRIAFLTNTNRGVRVNWIPSAGGPIHEVSDSETWCFPGWASERTLWVSHRRRGVFMWTEVDADTAHETGRTVPGSDACWNGSAPDPLSPANPNARIIVEQTSQIRFQRLTADSLRPTQL